jgi:hypothetical protein
VAAEGDREALAAAAAVSGRAQELLPSDGAPHDETTDAESRAVAGTANEGEKIGAWGPAYAATDNTNLTTRPFGRPGSWRPAWWLLRGWTFARLASFRPAPPTFDPRRSMPLADSCVLRRLNAQLTQDWNARRARLTAWREDLVEPPARHGDAARLLALANMAGFRLNACFDAKFAYHPACVAG